MSDTKVCAITKMVVDEAMDDINDLMAQSKQSHSEQPFVQAVLVMYPVASLEQSSKEWKGKYGECATCIISHKAAPWENEKNLPEEEIRKEMAFLNLSEPSPTKLPFQGMPTVNERSGGRGLCLPSCSICGGFGASARCR